MDPTIEVSLIFIYNLQEDTMQHQMTIFPIEFMNILNSWGPTSLLYAFIGTQEQRGSAGVL